MTTTKQWTLTVTENERDAIGMVLDLAFADQEAYLAVGSPAVDYGDGWEAVALEKARQFRQVAGVADRMGLIGEQERWQRLANETLETLEVTP